MSESVEGQRWPDEIVERACEAQYWAWERFDWTRKEDGRMLMRRALDSLGPDVLMLTAEQREALLELIAAWSAGGHAPNVALDEAWAALR